ncbi:MAG: hypothetical protein ISS15_05010 [Alphaproteobacteria bacterium]|nr:hypothetical protein [Alphaproteobacteria bacterium]MBL6939679.1 hypothetical protein [Alphaproteobacteria bacterium]MBL7096999.1 hypothetical protein [Alphaproteobacteria bacterium]
MRRLALFTLVMLAATTAAYAAGPGWHGPGWYVVMNTPIKQNSLYRGSYKTQDDCNADKPADHGAVQYECIKVDNQPMDGGY